MLRCLNSSERQEEQWKKNNKKILKIQSIRKQNKKSKTKNK